MLPQKHHVFQIYQTWQDFFLLFHIVIPFVNVFSVPLKRFSPTQDAAWARMSLEGMLILVYMNMAMGRKTPISFILRKYVEEHFNGP